jgi:predicted SprT family Zn-dependent metalloprotease
MKTTSTTPAWAVALVIEVCAEYKRRTPDKLQWYNTSDKSTSGRTLYNGAKIHISAGTDEWEHRIVLLHELAHHILAKGGRRKGHSKAFWELFIELNKNHGDIALAYKRDVVMHQEWYDGGRIKATEAFSYAGVAA